MRTFVQIREQKRIEARPIQTPLLLDGRLESIDQVQEIVAKHLGLKVSDLKSRSRAKDLVHARHIAIYVIRQNFQIGLKDIGKHFQGRDHSTILHACQKIQRELESDLRVKEVVSAIQSSLPRLDFKVN